jgi:hypothetical protein
MRRLGVAALVATIGVALWVAGTTHAEAKDVKPAPTVDRLEGYYYPPVTSREVYVSRAKTLQDSTRTRRLGFVSGLTQQLANMPYAPTYAIFAKGEDATRLLIVAYGDGTIDTVYRARALFATLTGLARLTPLFQELQVEELFTFFDLCKLLGFQTITVSDGRKFTHQVVVK